MANENQAPADIDTPFVFRGVNVEIFIDGINDYYVLMNMEV